MNIVIRGDFDPAAITDAVGLEPSLTWRKDDPWPTSVRLRPDDGWVMRFEAKRAWHLGPEIAIVVDYLEHHPEIAVAARRPERRGTIRADIDIHSAEGAAGYPGMYLEPALIERIQKTALGLDIDQV